MLTNGNCISVCFIKCQADGELLMSKRIAVKITRNRVFFFCFFFKCSHLLANYKKTHRGCLT